MPSLFQGDHKMEPARLFSFSSCCVTPSSWPLGTVGQPPRSPLRTCIAPPSHRAGACLFCPSIRHLSLVRCTFGKGEREAMEAGCLDWASLGGHHLGRGLEVAVAPGGGGRTGTSHGQGFSLRREPASLAEAAFFLSLPGVPRVLGSHSRAPAEDDPVAPSGVSNGRSMHTPFWTP